MPVTIRGIYHNLKESEYTASNGEVVFFFSSKLYRDKFLNKYKEQRTITSKRMNKITKADEYNTDMLSDFLLYRDIETRGFYAWVKGVTIEWQSMYLYALARMTEKNTQDWFEMQKPKLEERKRIMESTYQVK
ncbi:late transcriptional activator [Bacillus phage BeachBum]|uniref:Transcription regulator n=1 Tax=Bacillus phage BeachBum TaxID=1983461 RepID=A0A1X9SGP7_9CAUD|nr:late transcriptional activator [Bacillus phage BeachBum]ARQ95228.1 transcription regulator [Bacillus phage BeachBum]